MQQEKLINKLGGLSKGFLSNPAAIAVTIAALLILRTTIEAGIAATNVLIETNRKLLYSYDNGVLNIDKQAEAFNNAKKALESYESSIEKIEKKKELVVT